MFDYTYWPEELPVQLNQQIRNFHHKAQLLVDGLTFLKLGNSILKAQMGDKFFELVVFLPTGHKTLEAANLLYRLVQGGAKVGVFEVEIFNQELEQFAIFDSKILISNKLHEVEGNIFQLLSKKHNDFERIMLASLPVNASSQEIKMKFLANRYFVAKGEEVELSWEIENADSMLLNPGNYEIQAVGNSTFLIEKDILFTITSRNAKNKTTLSIFIKAIDENQFSLIVSVFNRELSAYVKIDSITESELSFAVYRGDLIRLEWACKSAVSLTELELGKLKNLGFHNFIALENRSFNFKVEMFNGSFQKELKIYPYSSQGNFSTSSITKVVQSSGPSQKLPVRPKHKLLSWGRKILDMLSYNGKN